MLSDAQKSAARYHGAQALKNRRSHLRRTRTALVDVRADAAMPDDDHETLGKACRALDRRLAALEADINEAASIKRDYDKRVDEATRALQAIPLSAVADVIALAELDHNLGRPAALLEDIEQYGWDTIAHQHRGEAIAGLARRCACETAPAAEFVGGVRAAMPAAAARHTDLIQRINTLAVAQTIERAARQPAGGL